MKRILFFDVDGTIYSSKIGYVRPRVKEAIHKAQKQGWICCIASGRSYGYLPKEIRDMNFDGYICANGAILKYKDELLIHETLNPQKVKELTSFLQERNIQYDLQKWDHTNIDFSYKRLIQFFINSGMEQDRIFEKDDSYENVVKIQMLVNQEEDFEDVLSKINGFGYDMNHSMKHLELFNSKSTKASAAQYLMEKLDIDESYSFGDSMNDYALAQIVDHSIVMENGVKELKEQAEIIAPSIQEDGVGVVLERWL